MHVTRLLLLLSLLFITVVSLAQPAARYDVLITEIMADPAPQVGLPNAEFIEIKNNSGRELDLSGWRLATSASTSGAFPNYTLPADGFLIISSNANATLFSSFGNALGISGFPSLPNDGSQLTLTSKEGLSIHAVNYSSQWFQNPVKQEGGWTLEMIDTQNPCTGAGNWKASMDATGGTPGKNNSIDGINTDNIPPRLIKSYSIDSVTIIAVFDESLDSSTAAVLSHYTFSDGVGLMAALPQTPLFSQVVLHLAVPLQKSTVYTLTVNNVTDCKGNAIAAYNKTKAGLMEEALTGDVVVNEILFNPKPNAFDYVEVYNKSNKVLDAAQLYLASRNASGTISSVKKFSETAFAIFPGDHIVLTEDAASLMKEYLVQNPSAILLLSSLPSFPDDEGVVILMNAQGGTVDEVAYAEKWHFALISDAEGVALERIDPDAASQNAGNWHSAAATAGYGTPTSKNSQYKKTESSTATIEIHPKIFSPDNDGYDDIAVISYQLEQLGYVANITIFNAAGKAIRQLVKNDLLELKGSWSWDGLDEKKQKLPIGTYIVYTELFNLQGKKLQFKKTVVLARKL